MEKIFDFNKYMNFDSINDSQEAGDTNTFYFRHIEDTAILTERTEEFYKIASELSTLINSLPLTVELNNKLVDLMIRQVQIAEHGAFNQGLRMGKELAEFLEKENTENEE
ncbi:MAG: hypothetical protein ACLU8W_10915 [Clostridia bacterium]